MDRETFTETIRALKHRTPFQPFKIITVGGNIGDLASREAAAG